MKHCDKVIPPLCDRPTITERHLNVPYTLARKYAHPGTNWFDELVSVGNEAIVLASINYKPGVVGKKGNPACFTTYLFGYVKHYIQTRVGRGLSPYYRKDGTKGFHYPRELKYEKNHVTHDPEEHPTPMVREAEPPLHDPEHLEEVRVLIQGLPQVHRDVLYWRFFRGLSTAEAGAKLGVTKQCVSLRTFRAMKALKESLQKAGLTENFLYG